MKKLVQFLRDEAELMEGEGLRDPAARLREAADEMEVGARVGTVAESVDNAIAMAVDFQA